MLVPETSPGIKLSTVEFSRICSEPRYVMPITVACPSCRKILKAPDNAAGHKVKCAGCGTALAIPVSRNVPDSFETLPVPIPAMPRFQVAKVPNRYFLFAAVGGGVLALLLLILVFVLALKSGSSKSSVEISIGWKTPNGVYSDEFDDSPVVVLVPKGMKRKIDEIAPIYAGEDYAKALGSEFRKCGAYLAIGVSGKAWVENVNSGSYTLLIFSNSFRGTIDEDITEDEARQVEQQLLPFFTRVRVDWLRKKPVYVSEIEVKGLVVDVRHEFTKRAAQGHPPQPRKTEAIRVKVDLKVTADELLAVIKANQIDAERKYKGKTLEVTGLVEKVDQALLPELDPQYFVWLRGIDKTAGSVCCGFSKFFDGFPALERGPNYREGGEELNSKGGAGISITVVGQLEWRGNEARLSGCSMTTIEDDILARLKAKATAEKDADTQAERAAEEEVRKAKAIKVKPSDLVASNAKTKFGGQVVEITAVVKGVRKGRYDEKSEERLIVELEFDKQPEAVMSEVACSFSLQHADSLAKIRPGQTITIRGRCDKRLYGFLWYCSVGSVR